MAIRQSSFTPPRKLGAITPRPDEQEPVSAVAAIESVISPPVSPKPDTVVSPEPAEFKVDTEEPATEQPAEESSAKVNDSEKPKATGAKRGRKSNKEKAEIAAGIPKYEIKPASVGVPVKFLVSEDEKDNFENALYNIRKLTGNKKMKNIRYFFLQGAYAQMFDMYCCRSCHRVWTALPGLAGEAPGTWDTCTCGSKDVEHLKNYD